MRVFINAGHGGKDPGATENGLKEKDVNLTIALACEAELKRHGVEVKMQRKTDVGFTSAQIAAACNQYKPNLAVDIHNNAGGGDGAEVFHHHGGGTGKVLAGNILNEVVAIGQNSRGAKTKKNASGKDYYYFIREIACPSVIVECAFLDNKKDVQIIDTAEEQRKMGIAIAKGVLKTLGVACKPEDDGEGKLPTGKLYRVQVGAYSQKANAEAMLKKLKAAGFDGFIV